MVCPVICSKVTTIVFLCFTPGATTSSASTSSGAAPLEQLSPQQGAERGDVAKLVRNVHTSRCLARSFEGKHPKEFERAKLKVIVSFVVLPGLAEADKAEGPALGSS